MTEASLPSAPSPATQMRTGRLVGRSVIGAICLSAAALTLTGLPGIRHQIHLYQEEMIALEKDSAANKQLLTVLALGDPRVELGGLRTVTAERTRYFWSLVWLGGVGVVVWLATSIWCVVVYRNTPLVRAWLLCGCVIAPSLFAAGCALKTQSDVAITFHVVTWGASPPRKGEVSDYSALKYWHDRTQVKEEVARQANAEWVLWGRLLFWGMIGFVVVGAGALVCAARDFRSNSRSRRGLSRLSEALPTGSGQKQGGGEGVLSGSVPPQPPPLPPGAGTSNIQPPP